MNFIPNILAVIKQFSKERKGNAWNFQQQRQKKFNLSFINSL